NKIRVDANRDVYRKRQAIVEHPYGVIKRQWGFYYIMTKKGINRASADVGLIFTAYNLRRIFNLIGQNELKEFLKELHLSFSKVATHLKLFYSFFSSHIQIIFFSKTQLNWFKSSIFSFK
ncbi:MAG: IS1182 family transposase, partial [Crocinitomicaceae bacterium]|nr:IS1182 family transposase [Crocinitomicaceae bacterium]